MSIQKRIPKRPKCQIHGGLALPLYSFQESNCLSGLNYKVTPEDIFVVSYPKAGTTWTQYIIWEILNSGASPPTMNDMQTKFIPFLEFTGAEPVENMAPPRIMKTHMPHHLIPYHSLAKYIYIARNPKDTCVSYYNHHKEFHSIYKYDGTLEDFFECFLAGDVSYGDWFDHVFPWYERRNDANVLFLTYEDLKRDPTGNVLKIARFLGEEYEQKLVLDPDLLTRILEYTSFQNMKKLEFYIPKEASDATSEKDLVMSKVKENTDKYENIGFFWRGKVGSWKEFLNQEQVERINDMIKKKPRGNEIAALWSE